MKYVVKIICLVVFLEFVFSMGSVVPEMTDPLVDTLTHISCYRRPDIRPIYSSYIDNDSTQEPLCGDMAFMKDFCRSTGNIKGMAAEMMTRLKIALIVDSTGNVIAPRFKWDDDPARRSLQKEIIDSISRMSSWTPGYCGGRAVNTYLEIDMHLDYQH